jgi:hypothetical protein
MARTQESAGTFPEFPVHTAEFQIGFWAFLEQIRNRHLSQALSSAVATLGIAEVERELAKFADPQSLTILATSGLRGETFLPVPAVLTARPELLGYYRLLYGISQKEFYKRGFAAFKSMEVENQLTETNRRMLPRLCRSLCQTGAELLAGVQPASLEAIHELQLLTIGPQLRGSQNNKIGDTATRQVFNLVKSLISTRHILIKHGAGDRGEECRRAHRADRIRCRSGHYNHRAACDHRSDAEYVYRNQGRQ